MDFEIKLKKAIREQYGSIRAFSQAVDMPYSTIDNVFKRGILGVSVQIALRICMALNIDIEEILNDELVFKTEKNINSNNSALLLHDEGIELYNRLDEIDKAEIRGEMKHMLKADKYKQDDIHGGMMA